MDSWENNYENRSPNFIMKDPEPESEKFEEETIRSSDGDDGHHTAPEEKAPKYVTRKAFVITLICAMIATSGLTALIINLMGGSALPPKQVISPTNYTLSKSTGSTLSVQEIIAKNQDAVVEITTETIARDSWLFDYVTKGAGSGVLIGSDGYILTCNHVVEGSNKIMVTLKNGKEYPAKLVGGDPQNDVAVIKIKEKNLTAATYGDSSKLSVGDMVVALGNPLGKLGGTASNGIISALDRELTIRNKKMTLLQTDASVNPGNSGGGLFDAYGNLIGIVVAKSSGSDIEGLGFAIPINQAAEIAKDLIKHGHVTNRPAIGVTLLDASDAQIAMQYNLRNTGLYVQEVTSREAKDAGLKVGDMFYYFGEERIENFSDLQSALLKYKPGDTVKTVVIRDNKTVELELHLIELTE